MTSLADRVIDALRAEHDALANTVAAVPDDQLACPSGATQWTTADVLSHLGSGAVITLAALQSALGHAAAVDDGFNQRVWDRWNAMSPTEQRDGFLEHDAALVAAFESLDEQQRGSLAVQVGFLPTPASVAAFGGMRLNEAAQHSWDVRVPRDSSADLLPVSARVLAELFAGEMAFLLGFIGKADELAEAVRVAIGESTYGLVIAESVSLVAPVADATATFTGPLEAALRLVSGRLSPAHTPDDVTVSGTVTLDDLRRVFPGY